ncbi:MAG: hypothetical protein ACLP2F_13770 [Steroidobacteraceae bacterium]
MSNQCTSKIGVSFMVAAAILALPIGTFGDEVAADGRGSDDPGTVRGTS